jgi:hypothetical protein
MLGGGLVLLQLSAQAAQRAGRRRLHVWVLAGERLYGRPLARPRLFMHQQQQVGRLHVLHRESLAA